MAPYFDSGEVKLPIKQLGKSGENGLNELREERE